MKLFGTRTDKALKDRAREENTRFTRSLQAESAKAEEKMRLSVAKATKELEALEARKAAMLKESLAELDEAQKRLAKTREEAESVMDRLDEREKAVTRRERAVAGSERTCQELESELQGRHQELLTAEQAVHEAETLAFMQFKLAGEEHERTERLLKEAEAKDQEAKALLEGIKRRAARLDEDRDALEDDFGRRKAELDAQEASFALRRQELDAEGVRIAARQQILKNAERELRKRGYAGD